MSVSQSYIGTALVTGAGAGLGRALTDRLVAAGWQVHAVDFAPDGLAALQADHGAAVLPHLCDLSSGEARAALSESLQGQEFDLVIHNAGISATGRFEEIEQQAHMRLLQVNTRAPLELTNALLAGEALNKDARLVFISSLSNAVGYPGAASYGASKDAIASYGASLRKRLKKQGIKVSVAFPGPLRTEHAARHAPEGAEASKRMLPEDAAKIILAGARSGKAKIYPGMAAKVTAFAGRKAPVLMAKLMRRIIYDKLDRNVAD
jgi:short-subunit dehydrogenase